MANDCLVTKLKAVVNNDNLLTFGKFTIDVTTDYENNTDNTKLLVVGGTKEYPDGITPPDASHVYYDDYRMFIDDKYNVTEINAGACCILDVRDLNNFDGVSLIFSNFKGNIKDIKNCKCSFTFSLMNCVIPIDISELVNIDTPLLRATFNANITGNIEVFGERTDVTDLHFQGTSVSGDLFKLAKRQINAGRDENTSGISLKMATPYMTFNGNALGSARGSNNILKWTYDSGTGVYTIQFVGNGTLTATYTKVV